MMQVSGEGEMSSIKMRTLATAMTLGTPHEGKLTDAYDRLFWFFFFWALRPVLPAYQIFLPFLEFLAKTRPKPPFGIPRAFQPPKNILLFFLFILFRIGSLSI